MTPEALAQLRTDISTRQTPLKAHYRDNPDAARVVLHAQGLVAKEAVGCDVDTHPGVTRSGLHPATGGDGTLACSGDMLLQALIGCAGVTLAAVATALGVSVEGSTIKAEGDLDFRGTLGVDKTAAVGFTAIRLNVTLVTTATEVQIESLAKLTERYCVVYQTLAKGVPVSSRFTRA